MLSNLDKFRAKIGDLIDRGPWPENSAAERLRLELRAMLVSPELTEESLTHYAQATMAMVSAVWEGQTPVEGGLAGMAQSSRWIDAMLEQNPGMTQDQFLARLTPPNDEDGKPS